MADTVRRLRRAGLDLIRDPLLNKGAAFTAEERRQFALEGLLPQRAVTIDVQRRRVYPPIRVDEAMWEPVYPRYVPEIHP